MKHALSGLILLLCLSPLISFCLESGAAPTIDKIIHLLSHFFGRIQDKTAHLEKKLTTQTEKYLTNMDKREETLKRKLRKVDSTAAKNIFGNSSGSSYIIGRGNGIKHFALSSEGVSLRSFIDIKIKGGFSAT